VRDPTEAIAKNLYFGSGKGGNELAQTRWLEGRPEMDGGPTEWRLDLSRGLKVRADFACGQSLQFGV